MLIFVQFLMYAHIVEILPFEPNDVLLGYIQAWSVLVKFCGSLNKDGYILF